VRLALRAGFRLSVSHGRARIVRIVDGLEIASLTRAEAVALSLLSDHGDAMAKSVLGDVGGAQAGRIVRAVTLRLAPLLVERGGDGPRQPLRNLRNVRGDVPRAAAALPGPRVLQWFVTRACQHACAYCYAATRPSATAHDSTFPRARLRHALQEASDLGARTLVLTGGEPLLREDLPEIMGDALRTGIDPRLATKLLIGAPLARRLARAGVREVALSLDTADPDINAWLVGDRDHARAVARSMRHLTTAGISCAIQAVVTAQTAPGLRALAAFAADGGAQRLHLMPLVAPTPQSRLVPFRARTLHATAAALARSAGLDVTADAVPAPGAVPHCEIGATRLFFLPDGVVHRCHRLAHVAALRGPDLREMSVAGAWHSRAFRRICTPPRQAYGRTTCRDCPNFRPCDRRGRCTYEAHARGGLWPAPDYACQHQPARDTLTR